MNIKASTRRSVLGTLAGAALSLTAGQPVLADDTELFVGIDADVKPNVLLLIDTSSSMDALVETQVPFDASQAWSGSCNANRVYWRQNTGDPPDCSTDNWFDASALRCLQASDAFGGSGYYSDRSARWNAAATRWEALLGNDKTSLVECQGDSALHGDGIGASELWATNGALGPWSDDPANEVGWNDADTGNLYTLYSGNFLNWFYTAPTTTMTRLAVVQQVAIDLINSVSGINISLMRFSQNGEGGMVLHASEDVVMARQTVNASISAMQFGGTTPLSESLFEAGQYLQGASIIFGNDSTGNNGVLQPSVTQSRLPANPDDTYLSPIDTACQRSFVVLLTDGAPTEDSAANDEITALPDFVDLVGAQCDGSGEGRCLDDMAEWMFLADLNGPLDGQQNVRTYTIGFAFDHPLLASTAERGGGQYFVADDTASLTSALTNIITEIQQRATTFAAPGVAVNAFNRTQNLNDLYIAVFEPDERSHWPGNLKKYRIDGNQIVGADGMLVVDPATGFFRTDARSFWPDPQQPVDGRDITVGGAANQLPDPADRRLFSLTGGTTDLNDVTNAVSIDNDAITLAMLGAGAPGDPSREDLIDFARGHDRSDIDGDGDTDEPRRQMGDPLHASAQTVIYGGSAANPDVDDAIVLVATNDGYLHAVDPVNGDELWAFVPPQTLDHTRDLFVNDPVASKGYGLDGNLRVFLLDQNRNGIVETTGGQDDRVLVYFGMRRGGNSYFALDITRKDDPQWLWEINAGTPGFQQLGQSWSTPVVTRVLVDGEAQNEDNLVLVFGGGYDTSQDNEAYSVDALGNGVYIVDALSGELLWRAGGPGSNADLVFDADDNQTSFTMNNAIPSDIRVLDLNSDGLADRMYVGDMGGRLWRFDIRNSEPREDLVAGGVIARLGAGDNPGAGLADNRRFYNAPDVALVPIDNGGYLAINIGSGYRAHPLNTNIDDAFFSIRDAEVFDQLEQDEYDQASPVSFDDPDLINVTANAATAVPDTSLGWRLDLNDPAFVGEKVLSEAVTFGGTTFFTTFTPASGGSSCQPTGGVNRLFQVSVRNAAPVNNLDGGLESEPLSIDDRALRLPQGGIAPSPTFIFPDQSACTGPDCPGVIGLVGLVQFDPGDFPPFFRTFWTTKGAQRSDE